MFLKYFSTNDFDLNSSFCDGLNKIKKLSKFQKFMTYFWILGPFIFLSGLLLIGIGQNRSINSIQKALVPEKNTFLVDAKGNVEKIYSKVKAAIMADHIINDLRLS